MHYIVSDIHGNFEKFCNLLSKLDFKNEVDHMLILGDVLDRGPDGIETLKFIRFFADFYGSIELVRGNHEMFCLMYLENTLSARMWRAFGGTSTLSEIEKMPEEQKKDLMNYLKSLPIYTEVDSEKWGRVICTHSGIHADYLVRNEDATINVRKSIEKGYEEDQYGLLCGTDLHYLSCEDMKALDSFLIVGHVPCSRLRDDGSDNHFLRNKYYIDIDAGCGHEGMLGCYVVETDEEIYV